MRPRPVRAALCLVLAVVVSCTARHDPLDPSLRSLVGTFVLQSLDGTPVPVVRLDYGTTRLSLAADTLTADGQGHYARVSVIWLDSVGRPYREVQRNAWTGTYAIRGDTIEFPVQCPPGALCIRPPVGWREADGSLVIATPMTDGFAGVMHFRRVP